MPPTLKSRKDIIMTNEFDTIDLTVGAEEEKKNFFQKFWETKVALPVTILTGIVAAGAGAGVGIYATTKKFKKAEEERKGTSTQPAPQAQPVASDPQPQVAAPAQNPQPQVAAPAQA